ncbi:MAG: hypothetical protein KAX39_01450 [candidate division Zixibacteria bacterium]|nr:hypothetical protein [candidate division Zixibacteria bacterium]
MKKRVLTFLVLVCFGLGIFVVEGFSATAPQKPKLRHISEDVNVDGPGFESYRAPSRAISKYYIPSGAKSTCDDINPQWGIIIQHDQIGSTWYEYQQNGSMGRMISVTNDGYRHFSWTYFGGDEYPPGPRYVDANCKNPAGAYIGQTHADGDGDPNGINSGYCNQTHEHDGVSVIIHHRTGPVPGYSWNSTITMDDILCGGFFTRHWDIPDAINGAPSGERGMWPKGEVCYDAVVDTDYVHVVMTEEETAGGVPVLIAWQRDHRIVGDAMLCETCLNGARVAYMVPINTDMGWNPLGPTMDPFDTSCSITPVVVVSPVSRRVAVAYLKPACDGSCDYLSDIYYIESMNNGEDWLSDCANWPPTPYKVIEYGCGLPNERAYSDLNATYDYNDSLHIVWVTCGFDPTNPGYYQPGVARLYHWSKKDGITTIHSAIWEGTDPGVHNVNIAKMSISAKDPIYHPGGDSVYVFCIWTQFDTADQSASDMTNGDIYGCGSFDGGNTWGHAFNLTNTKTPGCNPGECVSEHWSSLAQNMYDGDLHIQYICDLDAGGAIMDETEWMEVPVYYLHLKWEPGPPINTFYRIVEPPHWYHPPIKVTPGGSRTLVFKVFNTGYANCWYNVSSDHPCIQVSGSGIIPPKDSVTLTVNLNGTGACENTFIAGHVIVICSDQTHYPKVQAVVADDYYECPRDPETYETLDNGVLRLYTNANCEEQIHDIGTFPDTTHEVFFEGGTIVATTSGSDTVVGRFMREDWRAGARDKLYMEECHVDWEPDFWILYTKNIFIHNLNPPVYDFTWYWWEVSKQIKFFKEEAPEVYKHLVIKYVTVKRHDPPGWWPEQPPFTGYEDTYTGVAEDIDCPYDTLGYQNGRNVAGYDDVNHIAWQCGWDYTGAHPEYNHYYCGIALADPDESLVPYGTYNVRNDEYLYPQAGWGWRDGELYQLASTPGNTIQAPDSIVDRSWVFTARKIDAGSDPDAEASFTVVMVVAPEGLAQLQEYVDSARVIVIREGEIGGLPALCGDCNGDGIEDLGDIVCKLNYIFKGGPAPCPIGKIDCNGDGVIDVGDIIVEINFLFKNGFPCQCPGIW